VLQAESDLRKNTSRVRLLTQYVSRALEVKEAAEKEALAIEGRGNLNDAIGNEQVFDQMEASLEDAIWGKAALSRETLRNTGINSSSVIVCKSNAKAHMTCNLICDIVCSVGLRPLPSCPGTT
jgi:hypothetical protein